MSRELLFIRERFDHMGDHSGYDLLCEALEKRCHIRSVWFNHYKPPAGLKKRLWLKLYPENNLSPYYSEPNFWTEVAALKTNILTSKVIHMLYGENNYNLLGRIPLKNKIVVTVHQPLEWWLQTTIQLKKFFARADQIIVLSNKEKHAFEEFARGRVSFIPHGVDTEFFHVSEKKKVNDQKLKCVCVGQWLRDFTTLRHIVQRFHDNPGIEFHLVIPDRKIEIHPHKTALQEIIGSSKTIWHNAISDNELRALYQNSDLLLLPLVAATANNAILEAMACGLPVITNDLGGTRDHTHPSFSELLPAGDVDAFVSSLSNLHANPAKLGEMAKSARKFAVENFSWEIIAKKTLSVYGEI